MAVKLMDLIVPPWLNRRKHRNSLKGRPSHTGQQSAVFQPDLRSLRHFYRIPSHQFRPNCGTPCTRACHRGPWSAPRDHRICGDPRPGSVSSAGRQDRQGGAENGQGIERFAGPWSQPRPTRGPRGPAGLLAIRNAGRQCSRVILREHRRARDQDADHQGQRHYLCHVPLRAGSCPSRRTSIDAAQGGSERSRGR